MKYVVLSLIVINILASIIFKTKIVDKQSKKTIIFRLNDGFKNFMLFGMYFFLIIAIVFIIVSVSSRDSIYASLIFVLLATLCNFMYLLFKNKIIIYDNKKLINYNILGKEKIQKLSDVESAIEYPAIV